MTTTHSAAAMQPLLIWHSHTPVLLPTSATAASSPSSLANPPPGRGNEYPERCLPFLSTPDSCAIQIASTKWLLVISPSSLPPTLHPASFGDSPGFPQSAHKEFSALFHTSFKAFMLRSFPPAITSEWYPSRQGRTGPGGQLPALYAPAGQATALSRREGATRETSSGRQREKRKAREV